MPAAIPTWWPSAGPGRDGGPAAANPRSRGEAPSGRESGRLSFKDKHALEQLPARIAALETQVAEAHKTLADPALYCRDPAGYEVAAADLEQAEAALAAAEEEWLRLEMAREEAEGGGGRMTADLRGRRRLPGEGRGPEGRAPARLMVHMVGGNTWLRAGGDDPLINRVVVGQGADAADDWIAERIGAGDVAVTQDIPLASRCLKAGARALGPTGRPFTEDGIGMALAMRELNAHLRETGDSEGRRPGLLRRRTARPSCRRWRWRSRRRSGVRDGPSRRVDNA